jgi:hypothetical protein
MYNNRPARPIRRGNDLDRLIAALSAQKKCFSSAIAALERILADGPPAEAAPGPESAGSRHTYLEPDTRLQACVCEHPRFRSE